MNFEENLNIVRGDLKSKPVSSQRLIEYFETRKRDLNGTLYVGYPIIGTSNGGFQIDAILITRESGLVIFHIEEGATPNEDFYDIQDDYYTKVVSKLIQHRDLTKKRKLAFDINIVTFAPAWNDNRDFDEDYNLIIKSDDFNEFLVENSWSDDSYYENLLSVIQTITTIRKGKSRDYIEKDDSRGAELKKLEDSIANLDRYQSVSVIETVEGVQRIRGLAGSGKTIILALKVAYLHAKNPNWNIAVTFNTRSLKEQFKKYIRLFSYEHLNEEPNWEKISILHAWGTPDTPGIYYNLCIEHNVEFIEFRVAKRLSPVYGQEFDLVCSRALKQIESFNNKYDIIVVDEAQDFSKEFLQICYKILKDPKRLVYAYDELQSLNKKSMDTPEKTFGVNQSGEPFVKLKNEEGKPIEDIILYKCYRNPLETLTAAHALGFGIYRDTGKDKMVQMFEHSQLWKDIGYVVSDGDLEEGKRVVLERTSESSPEFLSNHSEIDDLIRFESFSTNREQVEFVVNEIEKNLKEDELRLDDIIVINTNPLTTKKVVGEFRNLLYQKGINSSLAGVSSSPDIFYDGDAITFTGIYRAKGNEAAMVYVINSQYCNSGQELAKKRNILFTAMTRSKAWVRVCGWGDEMDQLKEEYQRVKEANFKLDFTYPTAEERKKMNIVNRDMTPKEKLSVKKNEKNLFDLLSDLQDGVIRKEDLPEETLEALKKLLS